MSFQPSSGVGRPHFRNRENIQRHAWRLRWHLAGVSPSPRTREGYRRAITIYVVPRSHVVDARPALVQSVANMKPCLVKESTVAIILYYILCNCTNRYANTPVLRRRLHHLFLFLFFVHFSSILASVISTTSTLSGRN